MKEQLKAWLVPLAVVAAMAIWFFPGSFDKGSIVGAGLITALLCSGLLVGDARTRISPRIRPAVLIGTGLVLVVVPAGVWRAAQTRADDPAVTGVWSYLRVRAAEGHRWQDSRGDRWERSPGMMWLGFLAHVGLPLSGCIAFMVFASREEHGRRKSGRGRSTEDRTPEGPFTRDDLLRAVNEDDASIAELAIRNGIPVGSTDDFGEPLVFIAARSGSRELVSVFLKLGIAPDLRDPSGRQLLHAVGRRPDLVPLVRRLLKAGNEVDTLSDRGATPLMEAARGVCEPGMEALLAAGANPRARDRDRSTVLYHLLSGTLPHDDPEMVETRCRWIRQLVDLEVDPDAAGAFGETPLSLALSSDSLRYLVTLLSEGAGLGGELPDGNDLLLRALLAGRLEAATLIREHGAAVGFWAAILLGDRDRLEAFLQHDPGLIEVAAHPRLRGGPVAFALTAGQVELATELLQKGASAAGSAHHGILFNDGLKSDAPFPFFQTLVTMGGRNVVFSRDGDGRTPLHLSAASGRVDLIELLLAHDADPTVRTERGQTPFDMAKNGLTRAALQQDPS